MVEAPLVRREAPPSLDRDGYVVLPELLPAAAVASVRRAVGQKLDGPVVGACERPNNTLVPLRWNDDVVAAVTGDAVVDRLTAALAAADLRWISGYVSVKAPHSPPLWWHQDWWCWDHPVSYRRAPAQVALLTYLSDTHTGNGALRVLPGSHRHSVPLHAALPEAHSDESTALDPGHDAMRDQQGQATVALHAGDGRPRLPAAARNPRQHDRPAARLRAAHLRAGMGRPAARHPWAPDQPPGAADSHGDAAVRLARHPAAADGRRPAARPRPEPGRAP